MERTPLELSEFSVNLRKHVDPKSPAPLRLMAAKGMVPMAPQEMALVLYQLSFDSDARVKKATDESLRDTPEEILKTAFTARLPSRVLDWAAEQFENDEAVLQYLVTNAGSSDETIARIASKAAAATCDLIAENQVRLLRHPKIIEALYMNPEARMSTVDKIVDLARRNGATLEGLPALRPLMESKEPLVEEQEVEAEAAEAEAAEADLAFGQLLSESLLDEELEEEGEYEPAEELEDKPQVRSRAHYLSTLRIPERIRLAILGSREDRNLLIRDTNRLVHMAAVSSPKATDHEALNWANNRSLPEAVVDYIANRRDWFRHYQVKVNLINNPKLPLATAVRILPHLLPRDLEKLSRNRNVSYQLTRQAKELVSKRRGGRRR